MYKNLIISTPPAQAHINALDGYMMTAIYPVRSNLAMMVTNSLAGVRIDTWMIFERHMMLEGDTVRTVMVFIGEHAHLDEANAIITKYAKAVYGCDPIGDDLPF